jgi:hypothetical protein
MLEILLRSEVQNSCMKSSILRFVTERQNTLKLVVLTMHVAVYFSFCICEC